MINFHILLFSLFLNDLTRKLKNMKNGYRIDREEYSILLYADDIVLFSDNENKLQEVINEVKQWCIKWRLNTNTYKTKVLHFRKHIMYCVFFRSCHGSN